MRARCVQITPEVSILCTLCGSCLCVPCAVTLATRLDAATYACCLSESPNESRLTLTAGQSGAGQPLPPEASDWPPSAVRELHLPRSAVTDAGVAGLVALPSLTFLDVRGTGVARVRTHLRKRVCGNREQMLCSISVGNSCCRIDLSLLTKGAF